MLRWIPHHGYTLEHTYSFGSAQLALDTTGRETISNIPLPERCALCIPWLRDVLIRSHGLLPGMLVRRVRIVVL